MLRLPMCEIVVMLSATCCLVGCGRQGASGAHSRTEVAWSPPTDAEIPQDSMGASIKRGLALVLNTTDSLPAYAPGNITCTSCHINGGRNNDAAPLIGSHARYPRYLERTGAVVGLADRVNYCFTRSLAGSKLPAESREMEDILAYLAWLSRGIPVGDGNDVAGAALGDELPSGMRGVIARGGQVYATKCASCHQPNGEGIPSIRPAVPALWGPQSFAIGASMARQSKAASFIWRNMPLGLGKSLTPQEAFDVAAYISAQPRPDSPGKEHDWPNSGAPADVPYATKGHAAFQPPTLLSRANAAQAIVGPPRSVKRAVSSTFDRHEP